MAAWRRFVLRVYHALRPAKAEHDLAGEVDAHLALLEDGFRERGMSDAEARRAARLALGGADQTKERHRDARSFPWLDDLRRDVHYAFRSLRRTPGFTVVAILTLGLGIGANTAIFSVLHTVVLDPLPFPHADRLVRLYELVPPTGASGGPAAGALGGPPRRIPAVDVRGILQFQSQAHTVSHVVTYGTSTVTATVRGASIRLSGAPMSASAFPMLGVAPVLGRWFVPAEEVTGRDKVVILSYGTWKQDFGGDPTVLGQALTFTGRAVGPLGGNFAIGDYTIVGVMPASFHFLDDIAEFWVPRVLVAPNDDRPRFITAVARLSDNASLGAAAAELTAILQHAQSTPPPLAPRIDLAPLRDEIAAPVKPALLVLTGAALFVLLIACANVANLLLARGESRRQEMAVRAALGAGRGRLIRQQLTESLLIAMVGGTVGALLAFGCVDLFRTLASGLARGDLGASVTFPRLAAITVDRVALAFALAASVAAGLLAGAVPAVRSASRIGSAGDTRTTRPAATRLGAHAVLITAEITLATVLLIGGVLLIRTFLDLAQVELGYDPAHVLTFQVSVPGAQHPPAELETFADTLVGRLQSAPPVRFAAYANQLPTVNLRDTGGGLWRTPDAARLPSPIGADERLVSRDYFAVMGIRVIAGRGFAEGDAAGRPNVLVVNDALARTEFVGENPVGHIVYIGRDATPWTIVGVVGNARQFGLEQIAEPQFFMDFRQAPARGGAPTLPAGAYYAIRTGGDPEGVVTDVRALVRQINPLATLDNVATMDQIVSNALTRPRLYSVLLGLFAGIASLLAAAGIYGVMTFAVTQRTREIGIRMALGAQRAEVLALVLRQSTALTLMGIALGLGAAAATTRSLQGLLFGLTPLDPMTFVAVAVLFASVATLAAYVPARRATRVDPLIALRAE